MPVVDILPRDLSVNDAERDALLEVAYLVTAIDGKLADEEIVAFGELAARLHGRASSTTHEIDALMERFGGVVERAEIEARMREVARTIPARLHEIAYKTALAMAFVDRDPHGTEDGLHRVLGDALGLDGDAREKLSRAVTLTGGKAG
jgi:hypothetical protein